MRKRVPKKSEFFLADNIADLERFFRDFLNQYRKIFPDNSSGNFKDLSLTTMMGLFNLRKIYLGELISETDVNQFHSLEEMCNFLHQQAFNEYELIENSYW